ncbi:cytochrome P450 2F2-like [Protopterus annectens]|uniref:cytochrome P450 2F2-like n=1 Tax=Protopterus annectens TaxID=7888 RepID=UPI001CFBC1A2|nr:cytochrome P450 2F2-like [Protopterus annectens]
MQYLWVAFIILFMSLLFQLWKRPRNLPPGPWAIPVFGNFLQLDYRNPLRDFSKLAKRYGNVFRIYLGSTPVVCLHGYETVKEALVNNATEFAHRPKHPALTGSNTGKGIAMVPAQQYWKEHRRFSLMALRNFGMGKKSMEARIQKEVAHLVRAFEIQGDTLFKPNELILRAVSNVTCSVLFGHRNEYEDNSFGHILHLTDVNLKLTCGFWGEIYNTLPFLRCLPLPFQKIFKNREVILAFLKKEIKEHRERWIPEEPRDYIDCYFDEIEKRKNDGSSFDEKALMYILLDLLIAGTDTIANIMWWTLLIMVTYPDVQAKCYNELCLMLDSKADGLCYEDRSKLPYIQAVQHEVLRFKEVISVVIHSVSQEVTFLGYTIPKDTRVMVNIESALHDESQWKHPHEFNPSNFLNDKGEFLKPEAFIPFGAGLRVCLGENLAWVELFFFFVTLLKNFEFIWPDSSTAPDLTPVFGTVNTPRPFEVRMRKRD